LGRRDRFQVERKAVGHIGAAFAANEPATLAVTSPRLPHDEWGAQFSMAHHARIAPSRPPNVVTVFPDHHSPVSHKEARTFAPARLAQSGTSTLRSPPSETSAIVVSSLGALPQRSKAGVLIQPIRSSRCVKPPMRSFTTG